MDTRPPCVAIDLDTTWKWTISSCKGKIIIDMPWTLIGCNPFVVYKYICACYEKIIDNCLPLQLFWQFFAYASLASSSNWTAKKTTSQNKMLIKFNILWWTVKNFRTNNTVTPCQKTRNICLCTLQFNIKGTPGAVQHCRLRVEHTSNIKYPPSCR